MVLLLVVLVVVDELVGEQHNIPLTRDGGYLAPTLLTYFHCPTTYYTIALSPHVIHVLVLSKNDLYLLLMERGFMLQSISCVWTTICCLTIGSPKKIKLLHLRHLRNW